MAYLPRKEQKLNRTFQALSHPTRRQLLNLLSREDLPSPTLAARLGISRQNLAKHLKTVELAELATHQRVGRNKLYQLRSGPFIQAAAEIRRIEEQLHFRFSSFCEPREPAGSSR